MKSTNIALILVFFYTTTFSLDPALAGPAIPAVKPTQPDAATKAHDLDLLESWALELNKSVAQIWDHNSTTQVKRNAIDYSQRLVYGINAQFDKLDACKLTAAEKKRVENALMPLTDSAMGFYHQSSMTYRQRRSKPTGSPLPTAAPEKGGSNTSG